MVRTVNRGPIWGISVRTAVGAAIRTWGIGLLLYTVFPYYITAQTLQYSIGDPTSEEQLSLELINRARANPAAEGQRLAAQALAEASVYSDAYAFGTQLSLMKAEMAAIAPVPPLSFNEDLINVARAHNNNMLTANRQTHFSSTSVYNYQQRMDNGGYVWSKSGENIFASAFSVGEAHASFEIDWGSGAGGMRSLREHRRSIHDPGFREIGIGYLIASSGNLGPSLLTQDFGERISRAAIKPYITGVAIYDADGDNFYDIGEGIAGVRVEVIEVSTGQAEDHFSVTGDSGGYSVPVDGGAGEYQVRFTLPDGAVEVLTTRVESEFHTQYSPPWERGFNVKVDLILREGGEPGYTPPQVAGSPQLSVGANPVLDFPDLAGAVEYEVLMAESVESPAEQDAEVGAPVASVKSSSYGLIGVPSGHGDRLAFHLAHQGSSAGVQSMTLERVFVPGAAAQISFASRLRRSGTAQLAVLQVSQDWGRGWEDVWFTQSNLSNAEGFSQVRVDVSEYEGQPIQFRFVFYRGGGTVEYGVDSARGWHFDDIAFSGMSELVGVTRSLVNSSEFQFPAADAGDRYVQIRARSGDAFLPYADPTIVGVSTAAAGYAAWVSRQELQAGLGSGALAVAGGDYDGDGMPQLIEYALEATGFNPVRPDSHLMPGAEIEGADLCLHYVVDTSLTDVSVAVEVSADLIHWFLPGQPGAPARFVDRSDGAPSGTRQNRVASVPYAGFGKLFMRLRVDEL